MIIACYTVFFCAMKTAHAYLCANNCVCIYLHVSESVCMSWCKHFAASGELTRRLPPDPIDSDHPGLSWYACRVALTRGRQKKQEEWKEAGDRRTSRQWMIMMTRAILLASPSPSHSRKPGLGPESGSHMDEWAGSGQRGWSVTTRQGLICQLLGRTGGEEVCT